MSDDDKRVYDMVVRRFLAVFHPDAVFENTRLETTVAEHVFRTRGRVLVVPGWRGVYGEGLDGGRDRRRRRRRRSAAAQARPGRGGAHARGRVAREGHQAAAPLLRRVAARRDGDRRQARRGRRGARGDEGLRHRHAGHARGDHRAADRRRLRRARGPRAGGDREGHQRHQVPRRARADVAVDDRRLGAPAGPDRGGRGVARALHERHRRVRPRDGRRARREAQGGADPARQPRAVPGLRARHRREPQGLLLLVARGSRAAGS